MADIAIDVQSAPTTPSAGIAVVYVDSATKKLATKDDAGTVVAYGTATPPVGATTTSTGNQDDFAPAGITFIAGQVTTLRCNNASLLTIRGIAGGVDGAFLRLVSIGAGQVDLAHQNANSVATNRMINFATSGNTSLAATVGSALFCYDNTTQRWRLVDHEQGAWITRAFSAGNFTGASSMTWTVAAAGVDSYYLSGRVMTYALYTQSNSVGGTPSNHLLITIPGGFTATSTQDGFARMQDNGVSGFGFAEATSSATQISVYKSDLSNWTASTTNTQVQIGGIAFAVN